MRKALHMKDLGPILGISQRWVGHRISCNYRGGAQKVLLPFVPRIKKQKTTVIRYIEDWIFWTDADGNLAKINPCTLVPCESGGDVILEYYNIRYRYKLPEGAVFIKRELYGG